MNRFLVVKCLPLVLFLLLGIIPSHKANSADVCHPPFFKLGSQCFFFSIHEKKTWFEARQACKRLGGDLAEPKNILYFLRIKKLAVGNTYIWLGLSDSDSEGVWKGVSGNKINLDSAPWRPGNPDNYQGNEHYLMTSADNQLNDLTSSDKLGFACGYQLH